MGNGQLAVCSFLKEDDKVRAAEGEIGEFPNLEQRLDRNADRPAPKSRGLWRHLKVVGRRSSRYAPRRAGPSDELTSLRAGAC